ncbi:ATP-dependent exonuclease SbcCD, C subunit-like protein [Myxococcus sp. K15C18031901]|uniref:ATP-binding protein n=1 Tax=Myxococcus dinghuensis TaxID=2906761 RepID=UPI0020A74C46|nr:SbcC/MukB-like Walker B domain-containing protein [Myxococcus dinghuensis]MCP3098459.1 ATP-dependent exonuclease SbcCD, C subunit-like protein [Myxococcus dinghuensis]
MTTANALTQAELLDVGAPNERAGFRLHRFEVFNWGTFHQRVWHLDLHGESGLLTGDIGSGKSTLVDGLVTLLVPPQKLAYNKAAGAESRERSLRSYVRGQYKSERGEAGQGARPVFLRDAPTSSVLLAHFHNEGYGQDVTLAQVLWMRDADSPPTRLHVVADGRLSIAEHFSRLGSDLNALKKRLRALAPEVHETFPPYQAAFRRRFGLENEQALDLFLQTVSMKSVGNLTDFVRQHMLPPFEVESRLAALTEHFDDLHRAHEAVLKAKRQVGQLTPLVAGCERHAALTAELDAARGCREALRPWFSEQKTRLFEARLAELAQGGERLRLEAERLRDGRGQQLLERDRLKQAISASGGDRLESAKLELARRRRERDDRALKADRYTRMAQAVGLSAASDLEMFVANGRAIQRQRETTAAELAEARTAQAELGMDLRDLKRSHEVLSVELESLRHQRSNIPARLLHLRSRLCADLGLSEEALPFVGELLRVRDEAQAWTGAIERVLSSFGLSLLVADGDAARVSQWVERTHLDQRLVYFRVRDEGAARALEPQPASLLHKLLVKPGTRMARWLEARLASGFDYVCCDTPEQFARHRQALTRAGQVKTGGERHVKDDRRRVDDRSQWVLGWTNDSKRRAVESEARALEARLQAATARMVDVEARGKGLQVRAELLGQLAVFDSFVELDWRSVAGDVQRQEERLRELESESDVLRGFERQLSTLERELAATEESLKAVEKRQGRQEEREEATRRALASCQSAAQGAADDVRAFYPRVATLCDEAQAGAALDAETCDERERLLRERLQARIDAEGRKLEKARDALVGAMQAYRAAFPQETQEVDASIDAAPAYARMLQSLRADDLPRFEARFKCLLNENALREVANFQAQLHRERHAIRERVATINRSLRAIDYNPDRYIVLEAAPCLDADIRDFLRELRACTEGALDAAGEEARAEEKFLEVKRIIERFRGREGSADADARWTRRVTDVRNWFTFSASERWRADDQEHEHYADSGGKSGGQKEKLAYTVLAASLACQFGLQWGETRSRSFRFVVIDEAFGRGSDESAAYGLELFRRLDLQLLIVTPLQKLRVIEPYVASVGYVHNEEGRRSRVRHLTIEAYRAEREARSA